MGFALGTTRHVHLRVTVVSLSMHSIGRGSIVMIRHGRLYVGPMFDPASVYLVYAHSALLIPLVV